ncbi:MAG TPA: VOC family protein [Gaiellaceae bacterium]|nr:VOC family protein [Gaiellaceae bacterium]
MSGQRVTGIGGVFFRARNPEQLASWYKRQLGIQLAPDFVGSVFTATADDQTVWSLFPEDTDYFGPRGQQLMVNYRVGDLEAMLVQLREAGAEVDDHVEDSPFGRFGWATDPEGNRFELWEPV